MNIRKVFHIAAVFGLFLMLFAPFARASAVDNPNFSVVNLPTSEFETGGWPSGQIVTATVDPNTPGDLTDDYQALQITYDDQSANFQIPVGKPPLQPLWTISATDGVTTIRWTLPDVRVTSVNIDTDIITGTIEPPLAEGSSLWAGFFFPERPPDGDCSPESGILWYDSDGNWTVDFSQCDIEYGSWGALNYFDGDNNILIGSWHGPTKTFKGFYQPVDMEGVFNVVKGGSTVPLKFEVFEGSTELTDPSVIEGFSYEEITCPNSAVIEKTGTTVMGSSSVRYDEKAGQFHYNWKTPKTPGICYRASITTINYQNLEAYFLLK